jgi:hypothetical protein
VISEFLALDHDRLEALLDRASPHSGAIDPPVWDEFREGLLRHISMEEKILIPAVRRARGGSPLPLAARLRLDHGAIAALLVPPPAPVTLRTLRGILDRHNRLEEDAGGFYEACDQLLANDAREIVTRLQAHPRVPLSAPSKSPRVLEAIRRALARAGYELAEG